ncbi:MAG: hypothetical protein AB2531_12900 [Candidatus Thiodiazotropha sp.]
MKIIRIRGAEEQTIAGRLQVVYGCSGIIRVYIAGVYKLEEGDLVGLKGAFPDGKESCQEVDDKMANIFGVFKVADV